MEAAINMIRGSANWKVHQFMRDTRKGYFMTDIIKHFPDFSKRKMCKTLCALRNNKYIRRSHKRHVSEEGKLGAIWGVNMRVITRREIALKINKRAFPESGIKGPISKEIIKAMKKVPTMGLAANEILAYFDDPTINKRSVSKSCILLFKKGKVYRSKITLPKTNLSYNQTKGYVYGLSKEAVYEGIYRLMPESVKLAILKIQNSNTPIPGPELCEKTGISYDNQVQWLQYRFSDVEDLIERVVENNISYYYRKGLKQKIVDKYLEEQEEKSKDWRVKVTTDGNKFETCALEAFVKYKIAQGYNIKLPEGFPHELPNYLNKKQRDAQKFVYKDHNGYEKTDWKSDVFRFNSEPLDFIVFVRDKYTSEVHPYVISVKRDIHKKYGVAYLMQFVGAVEMGRTKAGIEIPSYKRSTPVFICYSTRGKRIYDFNHGRSGQAAIILTYNKMIRMIEDAGLPIENMYRVKDKVDTYKREQMYMNHREVIAGKITITKMMEKQGFARCQ
jgi:hypothetical protein